MRLEIELYSSKLISAADTTSRSIFGFDKHSGNRRLEGASQSLDFLVPDKPSLMTLDSGANNSPSTDVLDPGKVGPG